MWPVAKKIKSLPPYRQAILIYGSQNIEAMLKKNILNHFGVVDTELVAAVHELEMCAAQEANVCLAVTDVDLEVLRGYGAQQLVLAPNGIEPWGVKETQLNDWRERLPSGPWILYVASDHPPNVTGFITYMGEALGCIPPNAQLVIAGAVSSSLEAYLRAATWGEFNVSRMQVLGVLSEEDLAAVKTLAHAFLLPIEQRSGSNLKTAEALYSGAYVVGTDIAFRGYERYLHLPRVYIAKTPQDFRYMIGQVLRKPKITLQLSELDDDREFLTWRHCLSQATDVIKNFLKG
jgi:glycosyltransferase involved in cell wall biosynthesis